MSVENAPTPPTSASEPIPVPMPAASPEDTPDVEQTVQLAVATGASAELLVDSLGDYTRAWLRRIRSGDSGALPIVLGLVLIIVVFQYENSHFLTAGNLVNLLIQSATYVLLGMAEIFALLLSEIDLSIGFVAGVGGFITAELIANPFGWPWWAGALTGLAITAVIGLVQGALITRLHVPSFVVTLAGLLGWQGFMIYLADVDKQAVGGVISISPDSPIYKLVNSNMSPTVAWIAMAAVVGAFAAVTLTGAARRRARGLSAPPLSITLLSVAIVAVAGIALVAICDVNRGTGLVSLSGVPWVIPFVLVILAAWTWLLTRTRLGRYIYAIGSNPEAARRAGINVRAIRTIAFTLSAFTAGLAGIAYESRLGSMAIGIDGGTLVLYAVAAAVIGGTSLFGGRGKMVHALIGGLVVATVYNGLGLMGVTAAGQYMATALVLLAAVTVDSLARRRGSTA